MEKERSRDELRWPTAGGPKDVGEVGDMYPDMEEDDTTGEVHADWEADVLAVGGEEMSDGKTLLASLMVRYFGGGMSSNPTDSSSRMSLRQGFFLCFSRRSKPVSC